jgi:di/tricarboxylate transporter
MILAAWGIIVYMYARNARITIHREALIEQNDQLGPLSFAQGVLLVVLVIMVILWGFRSLIEESGIFGHGYVTDGTVSMLIGTLLFFIPHRSRMCFEITR